MCLQVLSASQAAKLAHLTGLHPSACAALCEEIKCQRCGPKLPVLLPTLTTVPKASHASTRLARMLTMTDITSTEVRPSLFVDQEDDCTCMRCLDSILHHTLPLSAFGNPAFNRCFPNEISCGLHQPFCGSSPTYPVRRFCTCLSALNQ